MIKQILFISILISIVYASIDCPAALNSNGVTDGGLVKLTMTGTVGQLLIDIPIGAQRDLAANSILAENTKYWDARGRLQSHYTDYYFQFRKYLKEPPADSLALPDDTIFEYEWEGPARRVQYRNPSAIAGSPTFDAVIRDYVMTVVIVTDVASILQSDPAFAVINGSITEIVDVPLDPTNFNERGHSPDNLEMKACLVEANYPPRSWSTSKPFSLFLDRCTVDNVKPDNATEAECLYCHCTPPHPTIDCVTALDLYTGRVTINATFTRIPWNNHIYNKWKHLPMGEPSEGANLIPFTKDTEQTFVKYVFFHKNSAEYEERCVESTGWRKLVTFDTVDVNNGKMAFHLGPVNYHFEEGVPAPPFQRLGLYYNSLSHKHPHTPYYSNFSAMGKHHTVATNFTKRGFCLVSSKRVVNDIWSPWPSPYTACDYQGISSGAADIYNEGIPCQWIDITNLPDTGKVTLNINTNAWDVTCEGFIQCNETNPDEILVEPTNLQTCLDDGSLCTQLHKPICRHLPSELNYLDDNKDKTKFFNRGPGESTITDPDSQYGRGMEIGLTRNNEHVLYGDQLRSCTIGSTVTLSCTIPKSNPNKIGEIVRVCESSVVLGEAIGCLYNDALAAKVIPTGPINTTVSFTCPGPRDSGVPATSESGGKYSIYVAHNVKSLAMGKPKVECIVV